MPRALPAWIRTLAIGSGVALLFGLAAWTGLRSAAVATHVSAVWPPAGILLWACVCFGPRVAPFLFGASYLAALATGASPWATLVIASSSVIAGLIAARFLRQQGFRQDLERSRDVLLLVLVAGATAALSSLAGTLALIVFSGAPAADFVAMARVWLVGDLMGVVAVAPALFTLLPAERRGAFRARAPELVAMGSALLLVHALIFGLPGLYEQALFSRAFLLMPMVVWAVLRFGPPGAAGLSFVVSQLAVAATAGGRGPFAGESLLENVLVLQLFLGVLTITALVLAALTAERQAAERQLVLAERLAAVGSLAAGVAHEINNPLAFVVTNLELLQRELGAASEGTAALIRDAQFGAERVRLIVNDLKVLSHDNSTGEELVSLDAVIESALRLAGRELELRTGVERRLGAPPPVRGSQARLGQVALNLLLNAAQAMPAGRHPESMVWISTGVGADGRAFLNVRDNGCGIARQDLPRIFTPFFTTKGVGHGTGLGLSICQKIIADHGGEISAASSAGEGTSFRIHLPLAPREAATPEPPKAARREAHGGGARVLVIDDEVRLAHSMRLLLLPEHEATVCTDAAAALALLLGDDAFDVILCDVHMPGMSGIDLYRRLEDEVPAIVERIVFMSGGACTDEARAFLERVPNQVLDKPVRPDRLFEIVRTRRAA